MDDTPNPESDLKNGYTLNLNNKSYILNIYVKQDNLIFRCTPITKKAQFYYLTKCTLNFLRKKSKAFQLYQNLTEILFLFEELNKNKLISLEIGDDDNYINSDNESFFSISNYKKPEYPYDFINLVIKLFVLVKEEIIIFPLEKKIVKENGKIIINIKNDINKINEQFNNDKINYDKKIELMKKEIKLLKNENISNKNQINELINKIEELKKILNKTNNKKNVNSVQDLINRVEKLEEWKNESSLFIKNINLSINDSQNNKKSNQIINKEEIIQSKNKIEKNNIFSNSSKQEKSFSEKNEEIEEEIEEEDNENTKKEENIEKDKKENDEIEEEEEEEEDDDDNNDEEEKEIINNNKTSFNVDIKYKEKLMKSIISNSNIIKNSYEIEFIINELILLNPHSFKLLYKGTVDTDNSKIFHQKCDGQKNIILFILTEKNYIFGGYTSIGFDSSGNARKDIESFLFSVDFQKIYEMKQNLYSIFCNKNCGPIFCGKSDGLYNICISDKFLKNKSYTCKYGIPFNTTELFELNHGETEFQVIELEVYKIE